MRARRGSKSEIRDVVGYAAFCGVMSGHVATEDLRFVFGVERQGIRLCSNEGRE
jgi:hypothetical protein